MSKRIALFNHKGGVSKTTTAFHLGWMLAEKGKTVILVDADPQCNLTGMVLGYDGPTALEDFYQQESKSNLRDGLAPPLSPGLNLFKQLAVFELKPEMAFFCCRVI